MGLPVLKTLINSTQIAGDHPSSLNISVLTQRYGLTGAIEGVDPQLFRIAGMRICTLFNLITFINVCACVLFNVFLHHMFYPVLSKLASVSSLWVV